MKIVNQDRQRRENIHYGSNAKTSGNSKSKHRAQNRPRPAAHWPVWSSVAVQRKKTRRRRHVAIRPTSYLLQTL